MRDIFYKIDGIGSEEWKSILDCFEQTEWNWISNNQILIQKHQLEIGLKENLYLARLLFALMNKESFNKDIEYNLDIQCKEIIDNDSETSLMKVPHNLSILIQSLEQMNNEPKQDKNYFQKLTQSIKRHQKIIDSSDLFQSEKKKPGFNLSILRRSGLVFYQLANEGFRAKLSITHIYKIYNQYNFINYYKDRNDANWDHNHPIFKKMRTQRRNALNQYEHRMN